MLSKESADSLISIISTTDETLNSLLTKFSTVLDLETRVICIKYLSLLLSDGILDHSQQIVALWILYKSFEVETIEEHPFLPLFTYVYEFRVSKPNVCSPALYNILICLLADRDISVLGNYLVHNVLDSPFPMDIVVPSDIMVRKTQCIRATPLLVESSASQPQNETKEISKGKEQIPEENLPILTENEALKTLILNPSYGMDFDPPFIRPAPELSPIFESELEQSLVLSDLEIPMIFDDKYSQDIVDSARNLLKRAVTQKIDDSAAKRLCTQLSADISIAQESNLSDKEITGIVENNPQIGYLIIRSLAVSNPQAVSVLAKMSPTPNVCNVVQKIVMDDPSNSTLLYGFCNNAVSCIRETRDNASASKLANQFCELMIQLIKSGTNIDGTLTMTLISACDDFRKRNIKQSATLRNLLHAV